MVRGWAMELEGVRPWLSSWRIDCLGLGCPAPGSRVGLPAVSWGQGVLLPILGGVHTTGSWLGPCGHKAGAQEMQRDGLCRQRWLSLWKRSDPLGVLVPGAGLTVGRQVALLTVTEKLSGHQLQSPGVGRAGAGSTRTLASWPVPLCIMLSVVGVSQPFSTQISDVGSSAAHSCL